MSEPFCSQIIVLARTPEFKRVQVTLQEKGVSKLGVGEFLAGRPVTSIADRLKLATILIDLETKADQPSRVAPQRVSRSR